MKTNLTFNYFLALSGFLLVIAMVLYPEEAFAASLKGLDIWWNVVFPALLPFFIGAQILMALGVVHFMGVMLEPFMRPLFNVPGTGSFVMAMGLASGYPIGSILTARLRKQDMINKTEAERLMSFTNTADPLFMAGAVAVGMFKNAAVAGIIMSAHYISALLTGLILRFYKKDAPITKSPPSTEGTFSRAVKALNSARAADNRPVGQILGDAVRDSVNTLLLIGGFIILFSVIIQMLNTTGFISYLSIAIGYILIPLGLSTTLTPSIISGLFEISLGTQMASEAMAPLDQRLIIASAIIAWSGLSVHAQVAAMIQGTDISIGPYIRSRLLHAILAGAITAYLLTNETLHPVFATIGEPIVAELPWLNRFALMATIFLAILALIFLITLIVYLRSGLRLIFTWFKN